MRAGRSRRSKGVAALGACLAAVAAVGVSPAITPIAGARVGASASGIGSSCADPESVTVGYGSAAPILASTPNYQIKWMGDYEPGYPGSMVWYAPHGDIICSARIQLANGSVAPPTNVFPYPTPTPTGGQYDETADPASHFSSITLTAAKPPAPAGKSCNFPVESSLAETIQHTGPRPAILVKMIEVSPLSLRLKLTPRKPNLVLCPKADLSVWLTDAQGNPIRRVDYYLPVKPHGGLTPVVTVPPSSYRPGENTDPATTEAWAFARVAPGTSHKARAKKARTARTAAPPVAQAASSPTTPFQCEKRYHQAQSRKRCFSHLPGASCKYPLEAQKAGKTTRGAHKYFKLTFQEESDGNGSLQTYAYAPIKNVAICPHGVVYKVSQLYLTLPNGEIRTRENNTKNIPEPTTRAGGEFTYVLPQQPIMSYYLVVKGYFIHPPWERRR